MARTASAKRCVRTRPAASTSSRSSAPTRAAPGLQTYPATEGRPENDLGGPSGHHPPWTRKIEASDRAAVGSLVEVRAGRRLPLPAPGPPHCEPGYRDREWSGQGQEQFLHGLAVQGVLTVGFDEALFEAGGDDGESGAVHGPADRGQLGDDVLAVPAFFDHPQHAAELALCAAQSVDHRSHRFRGEFDHVGSSVCRGHGDGVGQHVGGDGCSEWSAAVSRVRASVATACRSGLPVTLTMMSGSVVSTLVRSPSIARTTTLQGSSSPIDGSACSAAWASGGRQAPRITWGAMSAPSFAFSVACMSISVSTPNPCAASASRVAVRVSSNGRYTVTVIA